jgi:hypothetical protein
VGSLTEDVRGILAAFRRANKWQPGMVWDSYRAAYVWPSATYSSYGTLGDAGDSDGGP